MFSSIIQTTLRCNTKTLVQAAAIYSCSYSTGYRATYETISDKLKKAEYAVRGRILIEANQIADDLAKDPNSHPFPEVVFCNIGNPQQLGQKPITFFRQVLAMVEYPELIEGENGIGEDAKERARKYLAESPRGTGPYAHSKGLSSVRNEVASFIQQRDNVSVNPEHIFLTNGASHGVEIMMKTLLNNQNDGVMIPIPQYPLYSALIPMLGGSTVPYYLDESNDWGVDFEKLQENFNAAAEGVTPRAFVIINPGNPTGQTLKRSDMEKIVQFCADNSLVLLADEVYQTNVYNDTPFHSFKEVKHSLGGKAKDVQLVSFHSVSKGFLGECGKRGGYFELDGFDEDVVSEIYKLASISLCSNVTGMLQVGLMVNPPQAGDQSYELYKHEIETLKSSLKRRAEKLVDALNSLEGVSCAPAAGAMYAFPKITVPEKAVVEGREQGMEGDMLYCLALLRQAGLCVVPGSGFGQQPGTFHFRTTFLPMEDKIDDSISRLSDFHADFMNKYR